MNQNIFERKTLGPLLTLKKGKKPGSQSPAKEKGMLPYVDIKAFETGVIDNYTDDDKCVPCEDGDLLIVCDGSRSGYVGRAIKGYTGSTLAKIFAEGVDNGYLYYFIQSMYRFLNTQMKGTGTPHLNVDVLRKAELVIPSIKEQKQIVNKIEELFFELDSAVETLKKAKEQLAVYRQSVLKEAFEGRFTEQWRKKQKYDCIQKDFSEIYRPAETFKDIAGDENELNLCIPNEWKKVRIGEIFEVCVGGTPRRTEPSYWNGNICWVSSGEVKFRKIYETNECITEKGVLNSSAKVRPKGSVLLAMIGEGKTRGQAAVLEVPAAHNQNTASILVSKTPCSPLYLYYYFVLNYDHTRRVGSGNNQKALNKDRVKALRIPFCSFDEQKQIVFQIESRLSACENIEKTVNETLVQADAMRQSILKKAFDGSL